MKILYAECCRELVVPDSKAMAPRFCPCGKSAVWWVDPLDGRLGVYSGYGKEMVSVIGLHNGLLAEKFKQLGDDGHEYGCIQGDVINRMVEETPSSYLFKQVGSLVIRVRPGFTGDIEFFPIRADVPDDIDTCP